MVRTTVVVGASVAGIRTAQALRAQDWPDRIVVVGAEPDLPYDKPPLSKQVLAGSWAPEQARLLDPASADDASLELRLGQPAQHLDVAGRTLVLADGSRLAYDALVLATGATARPSPWRPPSGVHVLRTLRQALALREVLQRPGHVVVVGAGFIGAEVASTARGLGQQVTLVDPLQVPAGRSLGDEVGELFSQLHRRHGVTTRFGLGVERVDGVQGDLHVELTDGSWLAATTVVVGIGARPDDGWLADSGVLLDDGVVCDATGRAVGAPGVYAVGDLSRWWSPRQNAYVRMEHWTNAVEQAARVARTLVQPDDDTPHEPVEHVWSDQYDWRTQVLGRPSGGATQVLVGDPAAVPARFVTAYGEGPGPDGPLVGALCVNWPKAMLLVRRALAAGDPLPTTVDRLRALPAAR